jgi:homocysteine S-methyltransferase
MQSDLLGAYAIGIRNVVLVTGDPPRLGDYPDATTVSDVDAVGLTNMVSRLNNGLDMGGNPIGPPTGFHIGVAVNPGAPDLEREVGRFEWKVDAGAEFAVTSPVFDLALLARFLERIAHVRIPVIASIWPLTSYRNAEFLNNELPGVVVPGPILERMKRVEGKEEARAEGIAIAREILEQVREHVEGAQISVPFGRHDVAIEVIDGLVEGASSSREDRG